MGIDDVQIQVGFAPEEAEVVVEGVFESPLEIASGGFRCPDRDAFGLDDVEPAQFIESGGVIGMGVGIENGVDPVGPHAKHLLAQVRGSVDQDGRTFSAQEC
jgi:hypothetical protein